MLMTFVLAAAGARPPRVKYREAFDEPDICHGHSKQSSQLSHSFGVVQSSPVPSP